MAKDSVSQAKCSGYGWKSERHVIHWWLQLEFCTDFSYYQVYEGA